MTHRHQWCSSAHAYITTKPWRRKRERIRLRLRSLYSETPQCQQAILTRGKSVGSGVFFLVFKSVRAKRRARKGSLTCWRSCPAGSVLSCLHSGKLYSEKSTPAKHPSARTFNKSEYIQIDLLEDRNSNPTVLAMFWAARMRLSLR